MKTNKSRVLNKVEWIIFLAHLQEAVFKKDSVKKAAQEIGINPHTLRSYLSNEVKKPRWVVRLKLEAWIKRMEIS
jgi:hypothetical protein